MKTIKKLNIAFLSIFLLACATGAPKQSSSNIPQQEPTTVTEAPTTSQAPTATQTPQQASTELTSDEALEIALKDANVKKEDVTITKKSIDMDHGIKKHEFEFYSGNVEYEYDINALTGEIVSKSTKRYTGSTTASSTGPLTQEQALQVALQHANVTEKDIALLKTELDYEHGKEVFEFEFYVGNVEYNYTIDTSTGEIIEYEIGD